MSLPLTPLDATKPDAAEEWQFLDLARGFVPRGATFTVLARDKSREMELFMMSFGLLPEGVPLPSSYFRIPKKIGERAEYVLAFECDPRGSPGAALIGGFHAAASTAGRGLVPERARDLSRLSWMMLPAMGAAAAFTSSPCSARLSAAFAAGAVGLTVEAGSSPPSFACGGPLPALSAVVR